MFDKINPNLLIRVQISLTALAFVLLSIPAFNMTGLILKPLIICFVGGALISLILCFDNNGEVICGYSLLLFILFWFFYVCLKEFELQLIYFFPGKWIDFFYFDKLLVVGTIWLSAVSVFVFFRILSKNKKRKFNIFFRLSSASFIIFYVFLLVYSFVLIRLEKGIYPLNWVPFRTINEYISDYSSIPYEVFMMFFGNLLYFTPLGVIFHLLLKGHKIFTRILVITVFPLAAFTLLEFSQYLLQNGFCEFDDMLMNSLGFWLGAILGVVLDTIVKKASAGKVTCFWELK